ncbi:MAG: 4Fe-4S binding protein [Bacillota bacterium]
MKQLLILSGKGGTGKTTIASAFISLAKVKAYADCDVDAPNLHLMMSQSFDSNDAKSREFYGLDKAEINSDLCSKCGICQSHCRFDAISQEISQRNPKEDYFQVDFFACEGCGLCEAICPEGAVSLRPAVAGNLYLYRDETVFSTARLKIGSGNSGLLVSEVKKQLISAIDSYDKEDFELAIIDGSPGIGCPVIASISGVDMVLIVTEPSLSGISDMDRIVQTAQIFQPEIAICVNKYDVNPEYTKKIEEYCSEHNLSFLGKIPFDRDAVKAVNNGQSIDLVNSKASRAVKDIFVKTMEKLQLGSCI